MIRLTELSTGQKLQYTAFYTVVDLNPVTSRVRVKPEGWKEGDEYISISSNLVETDLVSAHQIDSEERKTASELADLFRSRRGTLMTVCFNKKPDTSKIANETAESVDQKLRNDLGKQLVDNLKRELKNSSINAIDQTIQEQVDLLLIQAQKLVKGSTSKAIKTHIKGEERVMVGRHYGNYTAQGHVNFIDMQIEEDPSKEYDVRMRKVDPRTIQWMIIEGVKYSLKK